MTITKGEGLKETEAEARELLRSLSKTSTEEEIAAYIRGYIKVRFRLEEEDLSHDSFNSLGKLSIARSTGADPAMIALSGLNVRCDAASESMTKKILLIMALNRELSLGITPEESASITTMSGLIERVVRTLLP